MADMREFGTMNIDDRGGSHDYLYSDERDVTPSAGLTPSQTVGPFFAYGLTPAAYGYLLKEIHETSFVSSDAKGIPITIEGQVFDGTGGSVHDACIEMVQADENGMYATQPRNDQFTGYYRAGTGATGPAEKGGDTRFIFRTIKPGSTMHGAAPFVTLIVTMRGLLNHCITRVYFEGDETGSDPVLQQVPSARRHTLIAKKTAENHYRFDIHMQGDNETVFFDI